MRVESKFLTADARVVAIERVGRRIVVHGLVKEFMPMKVEFGPEDLGELLRVLSNPIVRRVDRVLPERLQALIPARLRRFVEVKESLV